MDDEGAPVLLSALEARDEAATRRFCRLMRNHGIATVRVEEEHEALFARCTDEARRFFAETSAADKNELKMGADGAADWGYVEMPGVKEFVQMRLNSGQVCPWPETAREYFHANTAVARVCLAAMARGLETAEENFVDKMLDAPDAEGPSSTIFRFFHYFDASDDPGKMGCLTHTDVGLITLIPASNCPSLEVLDLNSGQWRSFEAGLGSRDVMVLCGETMEMLSAFWYPAVVHRVAPVQQDRYSLVYLMRARSDAVLDCASLKSPLLEGMVHGEAGNVVAVARFMRDKYLQKKSANFVDPGQGLPLANLKGESLGESEVKSWKEIELPKGPYEYK